MKIVLASNNQGKIREFNHLFAELSIELIPQSQFGIHDVDETALTFVENALIKARHASNMARLPAIADDSGLVVHALQGEPGIYSARYAGVKATDQDNLTKLVHRLHSFPAEERTAYYYCALVFIQTGADPTPLIGEGRWSGLIIDSPRGTKGFGYDPIFYVPSLQQTAAELDATVKNQMSHRGMAMQALFAKLKDRV